MISWASESGALIRGAPDSLGVMRCFLEWAILTRLIERAKSVEGVFLQASDLPAIEKVAKDKISVRLTLYVCVDGKIY